MINYKAPYLPEARNLNPQHGLPAPMILGHLLRPKMITVKASHMLDQYIHLRLSKSFIPMALSFGIRRTLQSLTKSTKKSPLLRPNFDDREKIPLHLRELVAHVWCAIGPRRSVEQLHHVLHAPLRVIESAFEVGEICA